MYDIATRKRAVALVAQGQSLNAVSRETGVSRAAIRAWQVRISPVSPTAGCPRCGPEPRLPEAPAAYAYLLGLYLGDGCISAQPRGSYVLRVACADAWPGLIEACREAVSQVRPANRVCTVRKQGCVMVTSFSKHWPCLLPQHGPGKKHERRIELEPWQKEIVDAHPWEFIRGLVHSDGCRITNWTEKVVSGERRRYEYPRYFFTNKSDDIRRLYCDALDRVGVEWKVTRRGSEPYNISVARRASVALMDAHIGAKY